MILFNTFIDYQYFVDQIFVKAIILNLILHNHDMSFLHFCILLPYFSFELATKC